MWLYKLTRLLILTPTRTRLNRTQKLKKFNTQKWLLKHPKKLKNPRIFSLILKNKSFWFLNLKTQRTPKGANLKPSKTTNFVKNKFFTTYNRDFSVGNWDTLGHHYSLSRWLNYSWLDENYSSTTKMENVNSLSSSIKLMKSNSKLTSHNKWFKSNIIRYSKFFKKLKLFKLKVLSKPNNNSYSLKNNTKPYWVFKFWRSKLKKLCLRFRRLRRIKRIFKSKTVKEGSYVKKLPSSMYKYKQVLNSVNENNPTGVSKNELNLNPVLSNKRIFVKFFKLKVKSRNFKKLNSFKQYLKNKYLTSKKSTKKDTKYGFFQKNGLFYKNNFKFKLKYGRRRFYKLRSIYKRRSAFFNSNVLKKYESGYVLKFLMLFSSIKSKLLDIFTTLYFLDNSNSFKFRKLRRNLKFNSWKNKFKAELNKPYIFLNSINAKNNYSKTNHIALMRGYTDKLYKYSSVKSSKNFFRKTKKNFKLRRSRFRKPLRFLNIKTKKLVRLYKNPSVDRKLKKKFNNTLKNNEYFHFLTSGFFINLSIIKYNLSGVLNKKKQRLSLILPDKCNYDFTLYITKVRRLKKLLTSHSRCVKNLQYNKLGANFNIYKKFSFLNWYRSAWFIKYHSYEKKTKLFLRKSSFVTRASYQIYQQKQITKFKKLRRFKWVKYRSAVLCSFKKQVFNHCKYFFNLASYFKKTSIHYPQSDSMLNPTEKTSHKNINTITTKLNYFYFNKTTRAIDLVKNHNFFKNIILTFRSLAYKSLPNFVISQNTNLSILSKSTKSNSTKRGFILSNIGLFLTNKFSLIRGIFLNFNLKFRFKKIYNSFVYPDKLKRSIIILKKKIIISRFFKKKRFKKRMFRFFKVKNIQHIFNTYYSDLLLSSTLRLSNDLSSLLYHSTPTTSFNVYKDSFIKKGYDNTFKFNEIAIPRIRFKPGYQRLWRKARSAIQEILHTKFKYQYRLTRHLLRYSCVTKNFFLSSLETTLRRTVMFSRLLPDESTLNLFLYNKLVFLNGKLVTHSEIFVYVGDYIQLFISNWYYIFYRWLANWTILRVRKLRRLIFRKNLAVRKKLMKFKKQKSNYTPNWIFNTRYDISDVKPYLEVDYLTLSVFVIYDSSIFNFSTFNNLYNMRQNIYRLYNWKYIT